MYRISIITVVKNNAQTIKDAIDSVLSQTYQNIEYTVIDGGSTDGTVEIIKSYGGKITKFISEPDNGIYDAMNKGIKLATGDIIGILNSDDVYFNEYVIENVVKKFEETNVDCVYGDLYFVRKSDLGKVVRYWKSSVFIQGSFSKGWHPPHPTFFVRRAIYEKYGLFDLNFKIAADYELMLRFLEKYKISNSYIPEVLVKMRVGGVSNMSFKNIIKANVECYRAWKVNWLRAPILLGIKKLLIKTLQYFNHQIS